MDVRAGCKPSVIIEMCKAHEDLFIHGVRQPVERGHSPVLYCPPETLKAFQDLMQGSLVLGTAFWNPYLNQYERFPATAGQLTPRHLQMLARSEASNTSGKIKSENYQGLLTLYQIATLRCLVKDCIIFGETIATHEGGFKEVARCQLKTPESRYMGDQSGHQAQDPTNIIGSYFYLNSKEELIKLGEYLYKTYPHEFRQPGEEDWFLSEDKEDKFLKLAHAYSQWQNEVFKARLGKFRPTREQVKNLLEVNWGPKGSNISFKGVIDLDGLRESIATEFKDALLLANCMMLTRNDRKKAGLRFPMAGMGAFSEGISKSGAPIEIQLTRLEAINDVLIYLIKNKIKLEGIAYLDLYFSYIDSKRAHKLFALIQKNLEILGVKWNGCDAKDFAHNTEDVIVVEFNAGDGHAPAGNEGTNNKDTDEFFRFKYEFQSLDPKQYFNNPMEYFNIAFNPDIRIICELTPAAINSAKACSLTDANDWRYQYQCAMEYPDARASALFYRNDISIAQIQLEPLKAYMSYCLKKINEELRKSAMHYSDQAVGKTALLNIAQKFDYSLQEIHDVNSAINLIRKMFFLKVIADKDNLTDNIDGYTYDDLYKNIKNEISQYLCFIKGECAETDVNEFSHAIINETFDINRHFLIRQIQAQPLIPKEVITLITHLDAAEDSRKLLNVIKNAFDTINDFMQFCITLNIEIESHANLDIVKCEEQLYEKFTAVKNALNLQNKNDITSILFATCNKINHALTEKIQNKVLNDFNEFRFQSLFDDLLKAPDSLLQLMQNSNSMKIIANIVKALHLINENGNLEDIYQALASAVTLSYHSRYQGEGIEREKDDEYIINHISDKLITVKLAALLTQYGAMVTNPFTQAVLEILRKNIGNNSLQRVNKSEVIGKSYAYFSAYLIKTLMDSQFVHSDDFASAFTKRLENEIFPVNIRAVDEIRNAIKQIKEVARQDPKVKAAKIIELQDARQKLENGWADKSKTYSQRIMEAKNILEKNEGIYQVYNKVLPEGFYLPTYDDLQQSCLNMHQAIREGDEQLATLSALFNDADFGLSESCNMAYWGQVKKITAQLHAIEVNISQCDSLSWSLAHKTGQHEDKARLENDIEFITQLNEQLIVAKDLHVKNMAEFKQAAEVVEATKQNLPDLKVYASESDVTHIQAEITAFENHFNLIKDKGEKQVIDITYDTGKGPKGYKTDSLKMFQMTISDKKKKLATLQMNLAKLNKAREIVQQKETETQVAQKKKEMDDALNAVKGLQANLFSAYETAKSRLITQPIVIQDNDTDGLGQSSEEVVNKPAKALKQNSLFQPALINTNFKPITPETWRESARWGSLHCLGTTIICRLLPDGLDEYLAKRGIDIPSVEFDETGMRIFFINEHKDYANGLYLSLQNRLSCTLTAINKKNDFGNYEYCIEMPKADVPNFMRNICHYKTHDIDALFLGVAYQMILDEIRNKIKNEGHHFQIPWPQGVLVDVAGKELRLPTSMANLWIITQNETSVKQKVIAIKMELAKTTTPSYLRNDKTAKFYADLQEIMSATEAKMKPNFGNAQAQEKMKLN